MLPLLLTALGVGGSTVIGALIGFFFKNISHKFSDTAISFAAGVMLAASIIGLILPSLAGGGLLAFLVTAGGVFAGAWCIHMLDKLVPKMQQLFGLSGEVIPGGEEKLNRVLLFVAAIALHNLPEGIAAGVGLGYGHIAEAITLAGSIALQNIPEGIVTIAPMLAAGVSRKKALCCAIATGLIEVAGTFLGYYAVNISAAVLPFTLAFAGGTMLYVISDEMIPETHSHGNKSTATYALLSGFCLMLATDFYI